MHILLIKLELTLMIFTEDLQIVLRIVPRVVPPAHGGTGQDHHCPLCGMTFLRHAAQYDCMTEEAECLSQDEEEIPVAEEEEEDEEEEEKPKAKAKKPAPKKNAPKTAAAKEAQKEGGKKGGAKGGPKGGAKTGGPGGLHSWNGCRCHVMPQCDVSAA